MSDRKASASVASKKRPAPDSKKKSSKAKTTKATTTRTKDADSDKERSDSSSSSASSSSESSDSEKAKQPAVKISKPNPPQKLTSNERLYAWADVKSDPELVRRLENIYGLDQETAKTSNQLVSTMPWVIRDLLGDHMCPSVNMENDIFRAAPTEDATPDYGFVQSTLFDLAQHIRNHYGKSGKRLLHVSNWIASIKKDLPGAYTDIARRFSQERGLVNGILISKRLQQKQQPSIVVTAPTEKEPETHKAAPGHDQEAVATSVLPVPESLPPAAQPPPLTVNVYKPPAKPVSYEDTELPPAPSLDLLFREEQDVLESKASKPNSNTPSVDELPPAPPLESLLANDEETYKNSTSTRPRSRAFRVTRVGMKDDDVLYSNDPTQRDPFGQELALFDALASVAPVETEPAPSSAPARRVPQRTKAPVVSVVTDPYAKIRRVRGDESDLHRQRPSVPDEPEDDPNEFDRLMSRMSSSTPGTRSVRVDS